MTQFIEDDNEKRQHEDAILKLCQEHPDDMDFIRSKYLEILNLVWPDATIRTYLTILITREVKALLKIQELTNPTMNRGQGS